MPKNEMSLRPQSQSTCQTCRLRKKKCPGSDPSPDPAVPQACKTCMSLNIPCYGFTPNGPGSLANGDTAFEGKPSWIDGTTAVDRVERAQKMEEIREGVKRATEGRRRERALRGLISREERNRARMQVRRREGNEIEKERQVGDEYVDSSSSSAIPGAVLRKPSLAIGDTISANAFTARNVSILLGLSHPHPHLESILLMHYIDQILPLQFPFYQPPPAVDGGRGWLLAIVLQIRPLYDAALSLAAWHLNALKRDCRRRNTRQDVIEEIRWKTEDREEFEYEQLLYTKAIKGLRERIEVLSRKGPDEGLKDSIEALACIVQLILLEVSKGDMESWRKHLLAAPDLHVFLRTYCQPHHLRLRSNAFSEEFFDQSKKTASLTFVDHAAMEFFSGVIIWFDILGSASTGLRPQYADICAAALGDVNSKVQLQNLMGCENWAMTIIRDIAVLEDWKRKVVADGLLSVRELVRKATDISQRLDISIARLIERATQFSNHYGTYPSNDSGKHSKLLIIIRVTHVFASAAQVYLNVVVSGPNPNLPEMRDSVARTLTALDALPSMEFIRNLTWPFCIAGCMAAYDQEERFRNLALAGKLNEYTFGTARKAVEVMEACWLTRRSADGSKNSSDWFTAMKDLGSHVLLL